MKKLFGGINLSWKKLIIFAIVAGAYTALMATLPFTKETSFRDIAVYLEWWILFGIIIISNSKSPLDSALKCFIFFVISQPLVYLLQVPFSHIGWGLFGFYKYWFILTLCTLPMGYIGYYINKKNWLSVIILLPMLTILAYRGLQYFTTMINNFPHHLLSFISCFVIIIFVVLNLFDKAKLKIFTLSVVTIGIITYIIIKGGIIDTEYETYQTIDHYDIAFNGKIKISSFTGDSKGSAEVVTSTNDIHSIKLKGKKGEKYTFTISDKSNNEYSFEYYYSKNMDAVILKRIK